METADIQAIVENLVTVFLPKVAGVIVLLVVSWVVAKWLSRHVQKTVADRLDETIAGFFGSLVKYAVLTMAVLGCLRIFGFETTSFAALIGAAGLAIGFALQGTLSNFASGVMLLAFRPFNVGDVISTAGITAKVVQIGLFATEFDTADNKRVIVPNGAIYGSNIENITFHDTRRVDVAVGTEYAADLVTTRNILIDAAAKVNGVLSDPAPNAVLTSLGASSIDWSVRVWANTDDYWAVLEQTTQAVKYALDHAEIGIPYPQMDVHLDGVEVDGVEVEG